MSSPSSVLTLGLGPWSDPGLLVTMGFGFFVPIPEPSMCSPLSLFIPPLGASSLVVADTLDSLTVSSLTGSLVSGAQGLTGLDVIPCD